MISFDIVGYIKAKVLAKDLSGLAVIKGVLTTIGALAIKIPFSLMEGVMEANQVLDIIFNFTGYTDYVYQYNAHAIFNKTKCVKTGNKRRRLLTPAKYIPSDVVTIEDNVYNNYFREKAVYLELNKEIKDPTVEDTSQNTISGFGICKNITQKVTSVGSAF